MKNISSVDSFLSTLKNDNISEKYEEDLKLKIESKIKSHNKNNYSKINYKKSFVTICAFIILITSIVACGEEIEKSMNTIITFFTGEKEFADGEGFNIHIEDNINYSIIPVPKELEEPYEKGKVEIRNWHKTIKDDNVGFLMYNYIFSDPEIYEDYLSGREISFRLILGEDYKVTAKEVVEKMREDLKFISYEPEKAILILIHARNSKFAMYDQTIESVTKDIERIKINEDVKEFAIKEMNKAIEEKRLYLFKEIMPIDNLLISLEKYLITSYNPYDFLICYDNFWISITEKPYNRCITTKENETKEELQVLNKTVTVIYDEPPLHPSISYVFEKGNWTYSIFTLKDIETGMPKITQEEIIKMIESVLKQ